MDKAKIFRKYLLENQKAKLIDNFTHNDNFLREIYNKFLFKYSKFDFFKQHATYFLNLFIFDSNNKNLLIEKSSEGEYRFISFLANIILKNLRNIIRKENKLNLINQYDLQAVHFKTEKVKKISKNNLKYYDKKCNDIRDILSVLNIPKENLYAQKSNLSIFIIELIIFENLSPKIVYTELLKTSKTSTYRVIDTFFNELVSLAKIYYKSNF